MDHAPVFPTTPLVATNPLAIKGPVQPKDSGYGLCSASSEPRTTFIQELGNSDQTSPPRDNCTPSSIPPGVINVETCIEIEFEKPAKDSLQDFSARKPFRSWVSSSPAAPEQHDQGSTGIIDDGDASDRLNEEQDECTQRPGEPKVSRGSHSSAKSVASKGLDSSSSSSNASPPPPSSDGPKSPSNSVVDGNTSNQPPQSFWRTLTARLKALIPSDGDGDTVYRRSEERFSSSHDERPSSSRLGRRMTRPERPLRISFAVSARPIKALLIRHEVILHVEVLTKWTERTKEPGLWSQRDIEVMTLGRYKKSYPDYASSKPTADLLDRLTSYQSAALAFLAYIFSCVSSRDQVIWEEDDRNSKAVSRKPSSTL